MDPLFTFLYFLTLIIKNYLMINCIVAEKFNQVPHKKVFIIKYFSKNRF
jgi:hypothetical protein